MNNVKIEWNDAGFQELLKDPALVEQMRELGQGIANRADGNYSVEAKEKQKRAVVTITCADEETYYKNLHTDALLKSL